MKEKLVIYWTRRDFRLRDNRALLSAVLNAKKENIKFLPVFIIEPYMTQGNPKEQFGYPSRYFLSKAIPLFSKNFKQFLLIKEKPASFFLKLAKTYELEIYVNEDVYPDFYKQLKKIKNSSINIKLFRDQITVDKNTKTSMKDIYSVFTPFKKAVWQSFINEKEDKIPSFEGLSFFNPENFKFKTLNPKNQKEILALFSDKESILIDSEVINLKDILNTNRNLENNYFSEEEALNHFRKFLKNKLSKYDEKRDYLDNENTSRMSLALAWGLVSSRTLVKLIQKHFKKNFENPLSFLESDKGPLQFISELIWREFYKYLLFHNPNLLNKPFQKKFENIKWINQKEALERFKLWIKGETGYAIVDAAMNELQATGYMHNRARMIVSSILTKNLGVSWLWGQEYFREMLIDLDEASNNGGWQWGASVGADPKPIRIFNPYLQASNYDPDNVYQNKWLSKEYLTNPPKPIIEHKDARELALERYGLSKNIKNRNY